MTTATLTISSVTTALPSDFILDVRDGLIITPSDGGPGRLARRDLPELITRNIGASTGQPTIYTITDPNVRVFPAPNKSYTATLWYYKLPALLEAHEKPLFPSDFCLVQYVRLMGEEWLKVAQPGTAQVYAERECAKLLKTGLGREPESTEIRLDPRRYHGPVDQSGDWMGDLRL